MLDAKSSRIFFARSGSDDHPLNPGGSMKKKKDATDKLYKAVIEFIESKGGKVLIIGGVETQHFPEDNKFNFRLAIRFTGRKPK